VDGGRGQEKGGGEKGSGEKGGGEKGGNKEEGKDCAETHARGKKCQNCVKVWKLVVECVSVEESAKRLTVRFY